MQYALVTDTQVVRLGRVEQHGELLNLTDSDTVTGHASSEEIRALGWLPVTDERPPLGPNQHHGTPTFTVRADDVLASYPPMPDSPQDVNARAIGQRLDTAESALLTIVNTGGTLTAAQLSNAVRVLARAVVGLIRLTRKRLDTDDGT